MRKVAIFLFVLALGSCQLDVQRADPLGIAVDTHGAFFANGVDSAMVTITLVGNVTPGKELTLTTTLGVLNPAAPEAERRTLKLKTGLSPTIDVTLYAEATPGAGLVTVTADGGVRETAAFVLTRVIDVLTVAADHDSIDADGLSTVGLTVSLGTNDPAPRNVELKTSLGKLSPDKTDDAARERTVRILPEPDPADPEHYVGSTSLRLFAEETAGTAIVSAELGAELESTDVRFDRADGRSIGLEIGPKDDPVDRSVADGQTIVPITVKYEGPKDSQAVIGVSTTLGSFDPSATTPEEQRKKSITVESGVSGSINLLVGKVSGTAVITATSEQAPSVVATLSLEPVLPTRLALGIVDTSVLDAAHSQTGVSVLLQRELGTGSISTGASIAFLACCLQGSKDDVCTELVSVPAFQVDENGDGRETTTLVLTPSGRALVNEEGTSSHDDAPVTLHAFVLEPDAATATCAELTAGTADVTAQASVALALRKAPPKADAGSD